jgi:hypothetical protein
MRGAIPPILHTSSWWAQEHRYLHYFPSLKYALRNWYWYVNDRNNRRVEIILLWISQNRVFPLLFLWARQRSRDVSKNAWFLRHNTAKLYTIKAPVFVLQQLLLVWSNVEGRNGQGMYPIIYTFNDLRGVIPPKLLSADVPTLLIFLMLAWHHQTVPKQCHLLHLIF